jgi:DNA modification methylase
MVVRIINADVMEGLKQLPDESVHCCVTSPPYWGLRDYGVDGQIGLEATPALFVERMVEVFREVRRVLRSDGTCWVNLGDSYQCAKGQSGGVDPKQPARRHGLRPNDKAIPGLKPKDLIGIPWRVAFALQADGWWLRGDHVWGKPNGMPESTEDRPSRAHEYVFMLTKSARYWYDFEAVRTAPKASTLTRLAQDVDGQAGSVRANGGGKTNGPMKAVRRSDKQRGHTRRHAGFNDRWDAMERDEQLAEGANLRSIWWVPPAQYKEAHFAVMPDRVAEICIRAGCPIGGTLLDPFGGAGTTGVVGDRLGRSAVLIELNGDYAAMIERRVARDRLERGDGTMADVKSAKLDPTPLEALMEAAQ